MAQQKYSIISRIDSGGMAEVWKGKSTSLRGFEKLVAIKRVLPNLAKNERFISMFLDEAQLSLHLNHANVVHTFDIGRSANDAYFIVMEWIDGVNLKGILETAGERGLKIPKEQAVFVTIEMCKGLNHAHNRRDPDGRPLSIVHRDVSPPNVLLSREGEVKIVDFGLAKAASQISQTDPGIVKGKFSYLSPEAAHGQKVDLRADIFSMGAVLWEMLAGQRLFDGETDLQTVKLVREAKIPSLRALNSTVEPVLEGILRRALQLDPRHRYQSSEAFAHDLSRYLCDHRLLVTSFDIAVLVKRIMSVRTQQKSNAPSPLTHAIQAELGQFTSIEDLDKMSFKAEAEAGALGTPAPDAEDPRSWAFEMGVSEGDALATPSPRPAEAEGAKAQVISVEEVKPLFPNDDEEGHDAKPLQADTPAPPPVPEAHTSAPPSPIVGIALGVLGAVLVGGAAWFFLFRS